MTNFSDYPRSVVTNVKGEARDASGDKTRWFVDGDGILHVTHEPEGAYSDWATMTFRLVEVQQTWTEVES